jgi:hypothetical protein
LPRLMTSPMAAGSATSDQGIDERRRRG